MPSFKKNLASVYTVNILNGVMGVLIIPFSLKLLGPEGYGLFSIYTVIASFISLLDIGIGKSLQRTLSIDDGGKTQDEKLADACGAYMLVMVSVAILLPAMLMLLPKYVFPIDASLVSSLRWIIVFACIEYLLFIPLALNQSICFSKEAFDKHAKFSLVSGIVRHGILFAAIYLCQSIVLIVAIYVLRRLVDHYLSHIIMGRLPSAAWKPNFNFRRFKELGTHAAGLSITRLLQTVLISMGSVLVNRSFGLEQLGYFRAAFDMASKIWFVSNGLGLIVYPKLVKAFAVEKKNPQIFMRLNNAMKLSWIIFVIAGSATCAMSITVLPKLRIHDGTIVALFMPIVMGICLNAHANLSYEVAQARGLYKSLNLLNILAVCLMTALFFFLLPALALEAVAWAWLITQLIYAVSMDVIAINEFGLPSRERNLSILTRFFSAILGISCLLSIRNNYPISIFLSALTFQILLLAYCLISSKSKHLELSNV